MLFNLLFSIIIKCCCSSGTVNMSLENICFHNKFGFCKFGQRCFRFHENKLCENGNCNIQNCNLRHPKFCRYFGKYNNCKFGTYCRFKHVRIEAEVMENKKYDEEIDKLRREINDCKSKIREKEGEIKLLEKMLSEKICGLERMKNLEIENVQLKTKIKDFEEQLNDLATRNESLQDTVAVNDMLYEDFKERMKDKYLYDSQDDESDYDSDEENRERKRQIFRNKKQEKRLEGIREDKRKIFKCGNCEFIGKTKAGLKTHKRIKHKETQS